MGRSRGDALVKITVRCAVHCTYTLRHWLVCCVSICRYRTAEVMGEGYPRLMEDERRGWIFTGVAVTVVYPLRVYCPRVSECKRIRSAIHRYDPNL